MSIQNPQQLEYQLQAWLDGTGPSTELIQAFRIFCKDSQLPEKYSVALENVLSTIQTSSLFAEES